MLLIKIAILLTLSLVFVQDFRSRAVCWVFFPCLAALFVTLGYLKNFLFAAYWPPVMLNISFVILLVVILTVYFSVKHAKWTDVTADLLGWGDILFLLSIAFYLSVLNFLFFFLFSLLAALVSWPVWQAVSSNKDNHIPLAGLQAMLFALFLTTDWWIKPMNITSDNWLLHLINK